ncbi:MAG: hypothetical protein U0871_26550 [Gemmataceae bacterium]
MTWVVTWAAATSAEIVRIAALRGDPAAVDQAVQRMDWVLRRYPTDMGESRVPALRAVGPDLRVWFGDVLGVLYQVDDVAMRVEVLAVGPARRR